METKHDKHRTHIENNPQKEVNMKLGKKLGAILIALFMGLIMLPSAVFAADGDDASTPFQGTGSLGDTVLNGSLIVHKYDIAAWERAINLAPPAGHVSGYVIQYFGLPSAGTELEISGQVGYYYLNASDEMADNRQPVLLSELTRVSNVVFSLESASPNAGSEGSSDPADYTVDGVIESYGKTVNGIMTWTGVPRGYYILTEIQNEASEEPMDPVVISMPMTDPTSTLQAPVEMKVIHIYPKNKMKAGPDITKDFTSNLENGNKVSWRIVTQVPTDIATAQGYVISDTLSKGLDYVDDSLKVMLTPSGGGTDIELSQAGGHFIFTEAPGTATGTTVIKLEFTDPAGFAALNAGAGENMTITYDTVVNLSAEDWEALKEVSNEVELEFANDSGATFTSKPPVVTIDEFAGLKVTKTDGVSNAALAGAKFRIYTNLTAGEVDITSVLTDKNGSPVEITTNALGIGTYYGLGIGTYYVQESEAPSGYKKLEGYETINITATDTAANQEFTMAVKNFLDGGFTLPSTGGDGTLWFTIIGSALVLVGLMVFVAYRKKRKAN